MSRLNSCAELEDVRKELLANRDPNKPCISVCTGSGCIALGAANVVTALRVEIKEQGLEDKVETISDEFSKLFNDKFILQSSTAPVELLFLSIGRAFAFKARVKNSLKLA